MEVDLDMNYIGLLIMGPNPNALDTEDTPLDQYDNQINYNQFWIQVDVQSQGQEFILVIFTDLCPNGVIGDTTFIEVPFMEINIEAESSSNII